MSHPRRPLPDHKMRPPKARKGPKKASSWGQRKANWPNMTHCKYKIRMVQKSTQNTRYSAPPEPHLRPRKTSFSVFKRPKNGPTRDHANIKQDTSNKAKKYVLKTALKKS